MTRTGLNYEPFCLRDGWYCVVGGQMFGPWPDKGAAKAGFETEKRRAAKRSATRARGEA